MGNNKIKIELGQIVDLLVDMECEYDRMTSSGKESFDKIWKILGMPTLKEIDSSCS